MNTTTMPTRNILSKSTFMYGCQCPKRLFLHKFKPELKNPMEEAQEAVYAAGTETGVLARDLFAGGVNAEPPDHFSYHISVAKTKEFIDRGETIIYEAAFMHEGVLCALDILVKENGKWYGYEVKGAGSVKPQHIADVSLQHYVIVNSGLPLEDISVVCFDTSYVFNGTLDVQKLFKKESVLEQVLENQDFVRDKIAELKKMLVLKKMPVIDAGAHCYQPYECDFTNHCGSAERKLDQRTLGTHNHDKKEIKQFFKSWEYPLYYFDFETLAHGIPVFNNSRPFQAIPFQYSLHVQKKKGGPVEHFEFLGDGVTDSRETLIKRMIKDLGKKGSIVTWYKHFELGVLGLLGTDYPKYAKEIHAIMDRVVDLSDPIRLGHYTQPEFYGRYSLKVVLPVMIPELSYDDLEIQEGMAAGFAYSKLHDLSEEDKNIQRKHLLEYCKLDTYAMVEIIKKIQ